MLRLISWRWAIVIAIGFSVAGTRALAKPTPSQQCTVAKLDAAGKKAAAELTCRATAAKKGMAVDPDCLAKAMSAFDAAVQAAEGKGGCAVTGNGGNVENAVDQYCVGEPAAIATGRCLDGGCPGGCGQNACGWTGATCSCMPVASACAQSCTAQGTEGFCENAGETCDLGTCTCASGGTSASCDNQRIRTLPRGIRKLLSCEVDAVKSGGVLDSQCVIDAETAFTKAFQKAGTGKGTPCVATNNAGTTTNAVIACVAAVESAVTLPAH